MKRTSRLLRNRARQNLQRAAIAAARVAAEPVAVTTAPRLVEPGAAPAAQLTLSRASGQWLIGDWQALLDVPAEAIEQHPERARLSLLVACAHLQCAQRTDAEFHLRRALQWGCDAQLAARLLISGVHNSLGRIAALRQDGAAIEQHFRHALAVTGDADADSAAHSRALREMASMGLLTQAAGLLTERTSKVDSATRRPAALGAELTMLRSEVELLQHQLSLALQRQPQALRPGAPAAPAGSPASPRNAAGGQPDMAALREASVSQLGQDLWVLERSAGKRDGFFVEFGATDGVLLSNTYLLETAMGWKGICAEPNPKYFSRLRQNRRCQVTDACIGARTGDVVEFVLAEEFGGMASDMERDMHGGRRQAYWAEPANRARFTTESLHDMLARLGAPRDIDYLSIDTEGSELAILSTFPFDRWNVRLISVEHNYSPDRAGIQALLEGHGYRRTEAQWDDWYERA